MAIFVGFDEYSSPGYNVYRPLYREFVTTPHCKFLDFNRRTEISLNPEDAAYVTDGLVSDFKYREGTVHQDDFDGLLYETNRIVEETYLRRGTFFYKSGSTGPEEREAIHVRDIELMTAFNDEDLLKSYEVLPGDGEQGI